jgi:hypothetical protein
MNAETAKAIAIAEFENTHPEIVKKLRSEIKTSIRTGNYGYCAIDVETGIEFDFLCYLRAQGFFVSKLMEEGFEGSGFSCYRVAWVDLSDAEKTEV